MSRRWWAGVALISVLSFTPYELIAAPAPLSNADAALADLAKELADQSKTVEQRLAIMQALGGWGTPQVRATLLGALKDPAPEIRAMAARTLGWPDNREALAALRERIADAEEVPMVKAAAIESLGLIGDPSVRPLVVAATKDPNAGVRQAALWGVALGPLTDPADRTDYLIQFAEDRSLGGLLRCDAIRALSTVKDERVVGALIRILETEPRFAVVLPEGPGAQQQLMELRRVQARDASAWAAEGLGLLKAKTAVPLLLKTAEDKSDYFLRVMSLRALIAIEVPEAGPVFMRRLEDPVPDNRILALVGLTQLADRTMLPPVLGRLTDPSPLVRAQAVMAAAALGEEKVRPTLETLQRVDPDSTVQRALEEALAQLPR